MVSNSRDSRASVPAAHLLHHDRHVTSRATLSAAALRDGQPSPPPVIASVDSNRSACAAVDEWAAAQRDANTCAELDCTGPKEISDRERPPSCTPNCWCVRNCSRRSAELAQTRLADFPAGQMAASDIAHGENSLLAASNSPHDLSCQRSKSAMKIVECCCCCCGDRAATADRRHRSLQKSSSSLPEVGGSLLDRWRVATADRCCQLSSHSAPAAHRSSHQMSDEPLRLERWRPPPIRQGPSESRSESVTAESRRSSVHPFIRCRVRSGHSAAPRSSRIAASNAHGRSGSNPARHASAVAAEMDEEKTNESHPVHLSLASDPTEARLRVALRSNRHWLSQTTAAPSVVSSPCRQAAIAAVRRSISRPVSPLADGRLRLRSDLICLGRGVN